jgi:hypothetical protein
MARTRMRRIHVVLAAVPLLSCLQQVSTGNGTETDPTASAGSTTASSAAGAVMPTGSDCQTDPQTQVTLCAGTSLCAGVAVDPGALPNCGFQIHAGTVIDLECLCGEDLCPIGVPNTCAEAAQLLSSQTALLVCEQDSEGHCTSLASPPAAAGAASAASPCDKQCETQCAGEPDCVQLCGC